MGLSTKEEWRPIIGYVGAYEVSSLGRVRSLSRAAGRRNGTAHVEGKVLALNLDDKGYYRAHLYLQGRRKVRLVHHLVLEAFVGPRPLAEYGLHKDGDRSNNRASNLKWGTPSENTLDSVTHGTHVNARKSQCIRGHEFTPENTYYQNGGKRACRACRRIRYANTERNAHAAQVQ